jgi:hypothetical protein
VANIYIYCSSGEPGLGRSDLEEALEEFFGDEATDCGAGSGNAGFNLDYEVAVGVDPDALANRLKAFLQGLGVRRSTVFDVFVDGWEPGMEWRRVEVFGEDRRPTKREGW